MPEDDGREQDGDPDGDPAFVKVSVLIGRFVRIQAGATVSTGYLSVGQT